MSSGAKRSNKVLRLSFALDLEYQLRLEELKDITRLSSNSEIIRQALLLYEDFVKSPGEGYQYYKRPIQQDSIPVLISKGAVQSVEESDGQPAGSSRGLLVPSG